MPDQTPNLAQHVADLLGRLSIMESLLPQIADARTRQTFKTEIIYIKNMVKGLQN